MTITDDFINQQSRIITGGYVPKAEQLPIIKEAIQQEISNRQEVKNLSELVEILKFTLCAKGFVDA